MFLSSRRLNSLQKWSLRRFIVSTVVCLWCTFQFPRYKWQQKDPTGIAAPCIYHLHTKHGFEWHVMMSLYRHRQRMLIKCSLFALHHDWLIMQVIFIELITSCATVHYVNGIPGRDTKKLCQLGPFVILWKYWIAMLHGIICFWSSLWIVWINHHRNTSSDVIISAWNCQCSDRESITLILDHPIPDSDSDPDSQILACVWYWLPSLFWPGWQEFTVYVMVLHYTRIPACAATLCPTLRLEMSLRISSKLP